MLGGRFGPEVYPEVRDSLAAYFDTLPGEIQDMVIQIGRMPILLRKTEELAISPAPQWMQKCLYENMARLAIEVHMGIEKRSQYVNADAIRSWLTPFETADARQPPAAMFSKS